MNVLQLAGIMLACGAAGLALAWLLVIRNMPRYRRRNRG